MNMFQRFYTAFMKDKDSRSRADAIKAHCCQCVGFSNTVAEIVKCTAKDSCPLWRFRPYTSENDSEETENEISNPA